MIDITGKQTGWIDHTKLDNISGVFEHQGRLYRIDNQQTLKEFEPTKLDPKDITPAGIEDLE